MSYLVAIDPGLRTGYVVINLETKEAAASVEIDGWLNVPETLETGLSFYGPDTIVVMERFIINATTHKKTNQEEPRDIIGAVKWVTQKYTGHLPTMQTAAEAKSFSTNDKLKKIGYWHVGGKGHANDAFRHALVYMIKHRLLDPKVLIDSGEE